MATKTPPTGSKKSGLAIPDKKDGDWHASPHNFNAFDPVAVLLERLYGSRLIILNVEDGVQLGDLQQIVDLLGQLQQLQLAALILCGGKGADQFADPRTVDVIHIRQVQQNFLVALG